MALGATPASAATEFPWPDLPVLYKVTRKAAPPASGISAPKAASATRARDTEDQELINAGGSGCSWDEGLCSKDIGPSDGWNSFGSFEVSINTQLAKVELWGKSEQRQAAICSGMTCNVFGVPENITMDPTNPGPLLTYFNFRFFPKLLDTCVKSSKSSFAIDANQSHNETSLEASAQLAGQRVIADDQVDVQYRDGSVYRFYISPVHGGVLLSDGSQQIPAKSQCAR